MFGTDSGANLEKASQADEGLYVGLQLQKVCRPNRTGIKPVSIEGTDIIMIKLVGRLHL